MRHLESPDTLVDLLALKHCPRVVRKKVEKLKLTPRQVKAPAFTEGLELVGPDDKLTGNNRLTCEHWCWLATPHYRFNPSNQLFWMARLCNPIVSTGSESADSLPN